VLSRRSASCGPRACADRYLQVLRKGNILKSHRSLPRVRGLLRCTQALLIDREDQSAGGRLLTSPTASKIGCATDAAAMLRNAGSSGQSPASLLEAPLPVGR
jgi:hypothetical protein